LDWLEASSLNLIEIDEFLFIFISFDDLLFHHFEGFSGLDLSVKLTLLLFEVVEWPALELLALLYLFLEKLLHELGNFLILQVLGGLFGRILGMVGVKGRVSACKTV